MGLGGKLKNAAKKGVRQAGKAIGNSVAGTAAKGYRETTKALKPKKKR